MNATTKWIIVLIAVDDPALPPQVIKERIPRRESEHLTAFLRGGELLDVLSGDEDESTVEGYREELEGKCLR
jgi:hypothetical protein